MAPAGVNTVRTYTAPPRWLLDLAHSHGLMDVAGCSGRAGSASSRIPSWTALPTACGRKSRRWRATPPCCWSAWETNPAAGGARWHGRTKVERFLRRLRDRQGYPSRGPGYLCQLPAHGIPRSGSFLRRNRAQRLPGAGAGVPRLPGPPSAPGGGPAAFLTELGLDSRRRGDDRQAEVLDWQARAPWEKGLAGVLVTPGRTSGPSPTS